MYYNIIDPGTFGVTAALSVGGIIQMALTDKKYKNGSTLLWLSVNTLIINILFMIFNFRHSHQNMSKNIKSTAKKTIYNALYDDGQRYRGAEEMTFGMFIYAFLSFIASLSLIVIGLYMIMTTTNNNDDLTDEDEDKDKMNSSTKGYFYTLGVLTSLCGFMGLIRLPLDYFIASLGVYWLLGIFFN